MHRLDLQDAHVVVATAEKANALISRAISQGRLSEIGPRSSHSPQPDPSPNLLTPATTPRLHDYGLE